MIHTVTHAGWAQPAASAPLPAPDEQARGLTLTDRAVLCDGGLRDGGLRDGGLRDGVPWVPVSGEIHYSRVPRERWRERLRQLRAGGVDVASTYAFWLHHVLERGRPDFSGHLDVAAFVDECAGAGLDVVLRIGPWAHGEARGGGFPDWVVAADVEHRTDDPRYLDLVREWFGQLAEALGGRAQPGGPIIAIQLENELYDRPEHLRTLKRLAREAGMAAPLWTATAWGGAQLPESEVLPLYGGYADGFWTDPGQAWDPSFRAHFLPSHEWDDPGVGADVRAVQGFADAATVDAGTADAATADAATSAGLRGFPPATCELGGGMATAYHRRPVLAGLDIAALAHTKIGNGSAWQGYYMYAGGVNPGSGLQESHATGYPNDLPEFGYDFHAPLGQSGDTVSSYRLLRLQHAFLAAFGPALGEMTSTLPDVRPSGLDDRTSLRWALRSDGSSGFAVISHHQPYERLDDVADVRLRLALDDKTVIIPPVQFPPVTIPAGTLARWPVSLTVGPARVDWATASALTLLPDASDPAGTPTLVLIEDAGIRPKLSVDGVVHELTASEHPVAVGGIDVIVLPHDAPVWVQERAAGRRLLLSDADLGWDGEDRLFARGTAAVRAYDPRTREWRMLRPAVAPAAAVALTPVQERAAAPIPPDYGFRGRRHSAPSGDVFATLAAMYAVELPGDLDSDADPVLDIDWAGDVAHLEVDGRTVDDRFWDGTRWSVSLRDAGAGPGARVSIGILPLHPDSTVDLPATAHRTGASPLCRIDAITLRARGDWEELPV